jgi:hypothetical protein
MQADEFLASLPDDTREEQVLEKLKRGGVLEGLAKLIDQNVRGADT